MDVESPRAVPARAAAINGARGLAALAVLLLHAQIYSQSFHSGGWANQFVRHLDSAVPVFFVLSGFLLYSPFAAAHASGKATPRVAAYAARRALRIFPGYWGVLIISIVCFTAIGSLHTFAPRHPDSFYQWTSWFGLFNQWGPIAQRVRTVPQSWTLDIEIAFYLVLPLVAAGIGLAVRRGVKWLRAEFIGLGFLAGISIAITIIGAAQGGYVTTKVAYLGWPVANFHGFALGMGLAVVATWEQTEQAIPRVLRFLLSARVIWSAFVLLLVGTIVGLRTSDPLAAQSIWNGSRLLAEQVAYVGLGALVVAPVILGWGPVGPARRLLSARPIQYLGTISYGVYLWHFFVFDVIWSLGLKAHGGAGAYLLWAVLGAIGTVVLASLSWRLIERPTLSLKRYFPLGPKTASSAESVPAVV